MDLWRFLKRKSAPTSPASLEITEGVSNAVEETGEKHPRMVGECSKEIGVAPGEGSTMEEENERTAAKKVCGSNSSKDLVSHYNEKREREFTWLMPKTESGKFTGMLGCV